ncbi:hypothetical protein [Streptomyces cacaoi]|uniref:hypothetical protein n=1 Tax=Streptomyces cacaoi TaxID=1898 RepID=UPI0037492918
MRYRAPQDRDFLDAFFPWCCDRFPNRPAPGPKGVAGPDAPDGHVVSEGAGRRDFGTLATLNHAMLVIFYVDEHRAQLDLVGLLDDSKADPVAHTFMEYIRNELPHAHEGFTDVFREFLYSRVKSLTMGIVPVHFIRWCLHRLPSEKFGTLTPHLHALAGALTQAMTSSRSMAGRVPCPRSPAPRANMREASSGLRCRTRNSMSGSCAR